MRAAQSGSIVDDVHTLNRRVKSDPGAKRRGIAVAVLGAVALMVGCSSVRPAKEEAPKGDPAALTVVAEIALERGDCKGASESYAKAAAVGAESLARRATVVSFACEHLPAAWESVNRWRTLAPTSREADAMYAVIALKLYHIPEARTAVNDFIHAPVPPPPMKSPLRGADAPKSSAEDSEESSSAGNKTADFASALAHKAGPGDSGLVALTALLLENSDAPTVLAAMSSTLEGAENAPDSLSLLGDLSLSAYDAQRAEHYARQALDRDPKDIAAKRVLARAYVIRGEAAKAIATAREAMQEDPVHNTFELAEVLT